MRRLAWLLLALVTVTTHAELVGILHWKTGQDLQTV